jgi:hypothetical protein
VTESKLTVTSACLARSGITPCPSLLIPVMRVHLQAPDRGVTGPAYTARRITTIGRQSLTFVVTTVGGVRFIHADHGEPTRRERGNATVQLAGPNVFGFPPTGRASPLLAEESQ